MGSFDGLYASLQLVSCVMEDAGTYKVVFSNEKGSDETQGKVNVKEDEKKQRDAKKAEEPKPEPKPFKMPKKVEKKPEPEPEPKSEEQQEQAKFAVQKKKSETRDGETIVQLEIKDTEVADQGTYKLVAKSETGETQSHAVQLAEEQVKMEAVEVSEAKEESK